MKNVNRILSIGMFGVVLFVSGCASSRVTGDRIVEYGVFKADFRVTQPSLATTAETVALLDRIKLSKQTDRIPAKLGTRFGMRFVVEGKREGDVYEAVVKIIHPNTTNPKNGAITTLEQWKQNGKFGRPAYAGFTFDSEWEIAQGKWVIEVWYMDKKVLEKAFVVIGQ